MRKEATLEQWKELYEITIKIKDLKPWEYLWDLDIITIALPDIEEPFYFSIMGRGGECFGISTYMGAQGLHNFHEMLDNDEMPDSQLIRYQNDNILCYFGDREELTKQEWKLIKDLGYTFRGKNNWIYFHHFEKGYIPYLLNQEQVWRQTQVFQQLYKVLHTYIDGEMTVDFEGGNTLLRVYAEEKQVWVDMEEPMEFPTIEYPTPMLQNEILLARLNKKKVIPIEVEIDIVYLPMIIRDKEYEKPVMPRMCILADSTNGAILSHTMIGPEEEDIQELLNAFISCTLELGKPRTLWVRDEEVASVFFDICEKMNVDLEIEPCLEIIDLFVEDFTNQSF